MIVDLSAYEIKVYSQNGEDGIILKLIDLIYGMKPWSSKKFFVEFGTENGVECNTRILREIGWSGLQMDGMHENLSINLRKEFITQENIVQLFQKYQVPKHFELLSIDIDFNDFYVLRRILEAYSCDIVIAEYNATHLPIEDKVIVYKGDGRWDQTNYFGASLLSFTKLLENFGYTLVYCERKGVNAFFVRNEILKQKNICFKNMGQVSLLYQSPKYSWGPNGGHPQDPLNRPWLSFEEAMNVSMNV